MPRLTEARPPVLQPRELQSLSRKEVEQEVMSPDYGAFIQVMQKRGRNISYISYALPRGISDVMLDQMMTAILYPEPHFQGDVLPSRFSDPDLPLLHRPGLDITAIDRMVSVPRMVLDTFHDDPESRSMKKYYDNQPKIQRELPGIKRQFVESLFSPSPEAKVADGIHIYHGAYEYVNGEVIGLNLAGTERFNLLSLPNDQGHQDQMNALVALLGSHENITFVLADKTKTVADCAARCAKFFEQKSCLGKLFLYQQMTY